MAEKGTTKEDVVRRSRPKKPAVQPVSFKNQDIPERKGKVKFNRANGGRRNNRKALLAEMDEEDN